jgi:hypothetical protein
MQDSTLREPTTAWTGSSARRTWNQAIDHNIVSPQVCRVSPGIAPVPFRPRRFSLAIAGPKGLS